MKKRNLLLLVIIFIIFGVVFLIYNYNSNGELKNNIETENETYDDNKTNTSLVAIPFGLDDTILCTIDVESNSLIVGEVVNKNGENKRIGQVVAFEASKFSKEYDGYFFNGNAVFSEFDAGIMSASEFTSKAGSWDELISYYSDNSVKLHEGEINRALIHPSTDSPHSYKMIYQLNKAGDVILINLSSSFMDKNTDINDAAKYLYNLVTIIK